MNKGILYAVGAFLMWGVLPVYWKTIQAVPAVQIVGHRLVWSLVFLAAIILARRELPTLLKTAASRRIVAIYALASALLTVNWLVYIWGVNAGYIVETSLGYFINPLVNVLLGVIFLREKLRPWQWAPVGLAFLGVLYLTVSYGRLPWIALVLAFTFGLYGLVKKTAPLESLHGLTLETSIMFLPALSLLLISEAQGVGSFGHLDWSTNLLLALTGVVTATPLLLFGAAARRIPLSTLGILQYIGPTCQFLIGVLLYHEPFSLDRLIGFGLIWLALGLYWAEGVWARRKAAPAAAQPGQAAS